MKQRRLFAALLLAALVALVLALPVSATKKHATTLHATLTGEQEVPGPGDPDGVGHAVVKVFKKKVCYTLEVKRIKPATAAHIHRGVRGLNGLIVVVVKAPAAGFLPRLRGDKSGAKQVAKGAPHTVLR